jgi:hypothetical protein
MYNNITNFMKPMADRAKGNGGMIPLVGALMYRPVCSAPYWSDIDVLSWPARQELTRSSSPHLTLLYGVHPGAGGALEVLRELPAVRKGSANAKHTRGVRTRLDPVLQVLGPVLGAPCVGRADPKHLEKIQDDSC